MASAFARPGLAHALSAELYTHIFSQLDRCDLVRLSQTCRVLFRATIGHIWRVVRLRPLLALLPGLCTASDSGSHSEPAPLVIGLSSKDYYARFILYAPYVEVLKTETWSYLCAPSKYFAERPTHGSLRQITLPTLKDVDMGYNWSNSGWMSGAYDKPSLMWMTLLIPPTLQSLSFTATDQRDLSLLGTLLARCPQLTKLKFRPDKRPNWDTWLSISAFRIPQEITSLEVFCAEINNVGYSWLSKLPKLQSLELLLCQRFSRLPVRSLHSTSSNPSPPAYPHAFSALRSLCISVTDKDKLQQIIQIWHTMAAHVTHMTIKALKQMWTPDMFDELFVGMTSHCSKVSFIQFHESEILNNSDGIHPLPVCHFLALKALPLRILKINRPLAMPDDCNLLSFIATLFPELEELSLEGTPIMIEELLQAVEYFPRIRHLEIGLHTLKPRSKLLSRVLGGYDKQLDTNHKTGSTLNLELCVIERQEEHWTFSAEDWDFIARLLTSRWSTISLKPSPIEALLERTFKVNERFASHSRAGNVNKCREETP